jgi:3-deoxy-D-manno-octulosonic-acid transferase
VADTPLLYRAYVAATALALPFAARAQIRKLRRAGMPVERAHEKLGHATATRAGTGPLIWFHAASVGESLSVLALVTEMGRQRPNDHFLITSGTATSAQLIGSRLPPRCQHQFAPLDAKGPIVRFLNHWRPDAAIFVESELWPQMLRRTHALGVPMILLNARLSAKSLAGWAKRPQTARYLLEVFSCIFTQNAAMKEAMIRIGARPERVQEGVNLKSLSAPLPIDPPTIETARVALQGRKVWVAASTHDAEETAILSAHRQILIEHPDACLILAPRHPERADAVAAMITQSGLGHSRRSHGQDPTEQVYLADTLGELGNWYTLAPVVFLGGSLRPIGGHNPYEVAQAGAAILSGPHVSNFSETYEAMQAQGAAQLIPADRISHEVTALFADTARLLAARQAAHSFVQSTQARLEDLATQIYAAVVHG